MGALSSVNFTFYQPNGEKRIIKVPADSSIWGAAGAKTTLNFHDLWNAAGDVTLNKIPSGSGAPQTVSFVGLVKTQNGTTPANSPANG